MRILLLGYGKMGKVIDSVAQERGHTVVGRIDVQNREDLQTLDASQVDAVIEFSHPESAYQNLTYCLKKGFPVVCGTTGWLQQKSDIEALCLAQGGAFFYASNYSIGVNLFFQLNQQLARLMAPYQREYEVLMTEIHHTEKKDAPSGTAITLAEGLLTHLDQKNAWVSQQIAQATEIPIWSVREGKVPGTHTVKYVSSVDDIEITHTARSREGFALGAVIAAEWIVGRQGVFGMTDLLSGAHS